MNITAAMFLVVSVTVLSTGEATKQSADIKIGDTFHLPQVMKGDIVINPSIKLISADWEFCKIEIRQYYNESKGRDTFLMTYGSKIDFTVAGILNTTIRCWGGKLSVEYYFQKLELAI